MEIVVNGLFYAQRTTGTHRYARSLMIELDKISSKNEYTILIPYDAKNVPDFSNLKVCKYGKHHGLLWEQWDFPNYVKKNNALSLNLTNTMPLIRPGIITIHDAAYKTHPEFFTSMHGKLSSYWHRIIFRLASWSKYPIITVSFFSKYTIIDTYKIDPHRVHVIHSSWQGIENIEEDETVLRRNCLEDKGFYFTLGHINYNKNIQWIIKYASKHPDDKFILSGLMGENRGIDVSKIPNVRWLGYLTDEEIVALYAHCKAFILPSIHEGFGMPPLEAMSRGAKVIIANTSSLPEIYRGSAYYIDAYDTDIDLDELLTGHVDAPQYTLNRFSFEKSAKQLKSLLDEWTLSDK